MTNVSRPLQICLAAFVVFAAVWFVVLRDHTSSTTGAGSSASTPKPVRADSAKTVKTTAHTTVVRTTKTTGSTTAGHATTGSAAAVHTTTTTTTHVAVVGHSSTKPADSPSAKAQTGPPALQAAVERQLQQNKTVLILFWNPKGSDDAVVRRELPAVQRSAHGAVAVHYAAASQVGAYGTITHTIQVNQTPTLLIVEPHGQTTTITGLTDAFAIEQAISEARAAAKPAK